MNVRKIDVNEFKKRRLERSYIAVYSNKTNSSRNRKRSRT